MSDNANAQTGAKQPKRISHIAYSIRDREGKDSKWIEIGVAFPHKDGKGFDILFDVAPLNGRIAMRVQEQK